MEVESNDKQQSATVDQGTEPKERPSVKAEQGQRAEAGDEAPVGVAELEAMAAAQGWHKPILEWREFARSTAALARRASDLRAIWFEHRLDPAFREELMVSVAAANTSRQCSFAHREWAKGEGLSLSELAAIEHKQPEELDARTWAAVAWAQAAARSQLSPRRGPGRHRGQLPGAVQPTSGAGGHRTGRPNDDLDEPDEQHRGCRPFTLARRTGAARRGAARAAAGLDLRAYHAVRPHHLERQAATQPDLVDRQHRSVVPRVRGAPAVGLPPGSASAEKVPDEESLLTPSG